MPDTYIEEAIHAKTPMSVFMVNGFQMRGVIVHEDDDYIVINSDGKRKMLYKHAISTIVPVM